MNDIFNFKRFGAFAVKRFSENWKNYLICLAVLGLIFILGIVTLDLASGGDEDLLLMKTIPSNFDFAIVIIGLVIAFTELKPFRGRNTSAIMNVLPVSRFESFVFTWLLSVVAYIAAAWLLYTLVALVSSLFLGSGSFAVISMGWKHISPPLITLLFMNGCLMFAASTRIKNLIGAFLLVFIIASLATSPGFLPDVYGVLDPAADFGKWFAVKNEIIAETGGKLVYATAPKWPALQSFLVSKEMNIIWSALLLVTAFMKYRRRQIN